MSLQTINERLDLVSKFLEDRTLQEEVVALLQRTFDSQRLVQKFSLGRGDAHDLLSLVRTIEATSAITTLLQSSSQPLKPGQESGNNQSSWSHSLQALSGQVRLEEPLMLASRISAAIDEDGLIQSHRLEESEAAGIVSLAQDVLQSEGSAEDQSSLPVVLRSKATSKAAADEESDEVETWIMRRTYVGEGHCCGDCTEC